MISTVVSAVCFRDADVWTVTARRVLECIPARRYLAIVPDHEIAQFRAVMPDGYDVAGDSEWLGPLSKDLVAARLPQAVKHRAGWYVQQFVKLAAMADGAQDDVNLIWDGDTIPVRPLDFVAADGRLRYYRASENHAPYFAAIEKLLGLKKATDFSFVAQNFPARAGWTKAMLSSIESRHGKDWREAILSLLPGEHVSEFSEYETLGQYAVHHHNAMMEITERPWSRKGYDFLRKPGDMTPAMARVLARRNDFYSFEYWDERSNMRERWERGLRRPAVKILSLFA